MKDKVVIRSTRTLATVRYYTFLEEEIVLPNGKVSFHVTMRHPGAVVILPIANDGRVLFLDQYRHSVRETILELPAGTLEPGEEPAECASRELEEETGFQCGELTPLGILYPAPGFCTEVQHLYVARDLVPSTTHYDEDECITVRPLTREETLEAIRDGTLRDGKSLSLILRAKAAGLLEL